MIRIDTYLNATGMMEDKSIRYRPHILLVEIPMCECCTRVSVSMRSDVAYPDPAWCRMPFHLDFVPSLISDSSMVPSNELFVMTFYGAMYPISTFGDRSHAPATTEASAFSIDTN